MGLNLDLVTWLAGQLCYASIAGVAIWGICCIVLMSRQIGRRRFRTEEAGSDFLAALRAYFEEQDYDGAEQLCSSPENWYRAVPILARGAVGERHRSLSKLRESIATRFEREILTELENRLAWVNTCIKTAPMLGLLGTVVGMIGAFSKMAGVEHPNPNDLAGDISVALYTTADGLLVAIPLLMALNFVQVRMRAMEDATVDQVEIVLEDLDRAVSRQNGRGGIGQRAPQAEQAAT